MILFNIIRSPSCDTKLIAELLRYFSNISLLTEDLRTHLHITCIIICYHSWHCFYDREGIECGERPSRLSPKVRSSLVNAGI